MDNTHTRLHIFLTPLLLRSISFRRRALLLRLGSNPDCSTSPTGNLPDLSLRLRLSLSLKIQKCHHLRKMRQPAMFCFPIVVDTGDEKREFSGETDMPWDNFYDRVKAYLDRSPRPIKIVCHEPGVRQSEQRTY
ncbi:hypothetical protein C8Q80DRAFT_1347509 [Daedaleopsis nitida]|nr:hypothetical protein C8Q80DRAFT_1347509 [Daedaleopsis nitida]